MESFDLAYASMTRKRYACSVCWGDLELVRDPSDVTKYFVLCRRCKDETRGYVTQYFVNRRRGESEGEKREVVRLLQTCGVLQKPPRQSVAKNLKDLGF